MAGCVRQTVGERKERERKDANNLILAAIAAAETESNYCLVLSAKDSSRRCRNRLSYSIAANADRAVLRLSKVPLRLKFAKLVSKVGRPSGVLRTRNWVG